MAPGPSFMSLCKDYSRLIYLYQFNFQAINIYLIRYLRSRWNSPSKREVSLISQKTQIKIPLTNLKLSILTTLSRWFPEKLEPNIEDDLNDPLVTTARTERQRIRRTFTLLFNQSLNKDILHDPEACHELEHQIQFQVLFPLADLGRIFPLKDKLKREQLDMEAAALVSGLKYRSWQIYMTQEAAKEDREREIARKLKEEKVRQTVEKHKTPSL